LIDAGIHIGRFDPDLMASLIELNRDFRRAQESLGLRITSPVEGQTCSRGLFKVCGTFVNPPGTNVYAITCVGGRYWPQVYRPVVVNPGTDNRWETTVDFGVSLPHTIYIVKASRLGVELIGFYRQQVEEQELCAARVALYFKVSMDEAKSAVGRSFPTYLLQTYRVDSITRPA
jgi:hypothetical protein